MKENPKAKKNRIKNGLCYRCAKPADKTLCPECSKKQKAQDEAKRKERKEKGMCLMCGEKLKPKDSKTCIACLRKKRERERKRKEMGLCAKCGKVDASCGTLCETCYFKAVSNRHFKTCKKWEEIKELLESQKMKCPYSKRDLIVGSNTSLDHKIPKSRGGTDDKSNLQWVYLPINTMKLNMMEDEFLGLIKEIHAGL
jgi:hypothetical protein